MNVPFSSIHIPKFTFPPEHCKVLALGLRSTKCDTPKARILEYEKRHSSVLNDVYAWIPDVRFIALRDLSCDDTARSMVKNGIHTYRDNDHLNIPGSQYVGAEIVRRYSPA